MKRTVFLVPMVSSLEIFHCIMVSMELYHFYAGMCFDAFFRQLVSLINYIRLIMKTLNTYLLEILLSSFLR